MCLSKIYVSCISLYKLNPDKLTTPFESAHQFTLVCTVSDSKTVLGCHYNSCSNHSFVLTNSYLNLSLFRAVFSLPGLFLPLLYTDLCLLQPWSERFFFVVVLRALRKCSCHDRDSPSTLDPPPMVEFMELHACSVRIKGRQALKWGTCSNSNTEQRHSIVARQRTSVSFKLAVRVDSGAGGLVAPLPCTAYFGKLAKLFGCFLPQQALA